jgi:hypothetical protein
MMFPHDIYFGITRTSPSWRSETDNLAVEIGLNVPPSE